MIDAVVDVTRFLDQRANGVLLLDPSASGSTTCLATLSILTSAFVNTGVPTKVGFILLDAAAINLVAMVLVAFFFGALLGMGLPPAPTYILTALVIAPHMIKAGLEPWPVHFFAFFLAVWGELTPPTSVVAAVTSKIAQASFFRTLMLAIKLCISLFVLMAAMFVRPGLYKREKLVMWPFMLLSFPLFVGGGTFLYYIVYPYAIEFLVNYDKTLVPSLRVGDYLSFTVRLLIVFGLVFELPLISLFLTRMGMITHKFLIRGRRYAIVIIFLFAAVFTPPDVFTQVLLGVPVIILYEISIVVSYLARKRE